MDVDIDIDIDVDIIQSSLDPTQLLHSLSESTYLYGVPVTCHIGACPELVLAGCSMEA